MSRVLTQSFKFTAAQTFLQGVSNAAREAYQWVYDLNKTVTDISIVTGYQGEQLDRVTQSAIQGAKELRIAANEYAQGALIFYQQGLNDDEVARRTEITVKAARAAGSSMEEMSSQLTAVWNTYKMTGDEMQRAASVGAKMAGDTAVDFADIAEAMQTAAAPAEQMGVSYNSLAAIIATVGDTTQQSASVIGNAFKTIFSRFQQLKSEGTDGEVTLNRVSSQLQELGVNVLDSSGELRQLDDVIMEVGNSWEGWSSKQQLAIAQLVGGTRQYGQFLTLMNNFDKYQNLLGSANMEDGSTLEQQYAASLDSIESHAQNAAESMKRAFGQLFDEDLLKGAFTTIEGIGDILGSIIQTLGGGVGIITQIAAALSSKVGPALANAAKNATLFVNNLSHSGRQANIDREFEENTKEYEAKRAENRRINDSGQQEIVDKDLERSLNLQQQKNNFSHQTATINERINTLLKTATGEERIQLQIKQQNLKTAQEEYQIQLDNLNTLQKQLEQEERRLNLAKQRQVAEASQEVKKAKENEEKKTSNLNSAKERLEKADAAIESDTTNDESVMKKLLAEQEEAQRAYAQAQKEAAQATEERIAAENKLQQAVAQQKNTTNESVLSVNKMTAAYKTGNASATDLKEAMQTSGKAIIEQYNGVALALEDAGLAEQAQEARAEIERLTQAIDNLNGDDDDPFDDILSGLNNMANQLPEVTDEVRDLSSQTFESSSSLQQMGERAQHSDVNMPEQTRGQRLGSRVSSAVSSGLGKVSNFLQSNEQVISGITQIGTSAAATISTVQGMWDVLGNPDASIMEKVTSVGTGIASIVPNIMNVIDGFKMLPPQVAIATVAIGATIAAVAALWNEFQKYTAEAQFKRMSEAAAQLKSDAEEARSEADALKSSIESYNSARSALDNCTKGTEEWKDALAATNDAAQDVINSISDLEGVDLSNLYERDENGMLMLNQDELEKIQGEADSLATQKEFAAQMAEINASQLGNQVTAKNIASEYTMGAGGAIVGGAATGAMIGSAAGPIGAAIGGIIGGLGGAITEDIQDAQIGERIMENLDELTDLDTDDLRNKLSSFGMDVSSLSDTAIEQLRVRLQDLANSSAAAQEKLELIAGMAVDEQLGDAYSGEAKDVVSKQVAADQQKLTEEWTSFMEDNFSKVSDGSEENRNKLVEAFNTAMGTNYSAAGNFSQGTDGNRVFAFRNEVTGEIETFTKEYIASTIAAQQALEGLEVSAQEAETMLKNLSVTGDDGKKDEGATQAVRDFISSGNLDSATKGDFETLKQGVEDAGGAQQYLESIGFTPEIAEQYAADFEAALEIDWDSVTAKLPESFKNAEELTLTQARGFGDTYQKIMGIAGEGAGKEYENMMSGILNGITDGDMQDQARDILAGIDWTQWDAAEQAAAALADIGVELDTSSESWQAFEASMRSTFKAVPDIKALAEEINNVKSISEGLELGSIISQEDYQTLVNFNSELGRYFTILADGTAKMTGDPLDFIQEVRSSEQEQLKEQIAAAQQMAEELQGVSGSQNYQGDDGKNYYRGSNVQTQLDYIQAYGNVDQSQIDSWRADLEDGHSTVETINAIGAAFDELGMSAETAGNTAQTAMTQLAMTAGSAEERMEMLESGEINESAYGAAALSAINEEKWEGLDVEEVENYSDHLQDLAGNSELVDSSLAENEETAEEVARAVMKTNDGVEKLSEGFEDWSDIIENSDEASEEYCDAMSGMKDALSDVLGVSEEFIDNDFIKENMDDIAKAAEGDAEAIDNLRAALAEDLILDFTVDGSTAEQEALQAHADLTAKLAGKKVGFTVTADMDTTGILTAAQGVVDSAAMSVEEAQAYFNSLGYEPVFEMTEQTVQSKKPITETYTQDAGTTYETYETVNPDGTVSTQTVPFVRTRSFSKVVGYSTQDEVMQVPALSADGTPKITELKKINSGSLNNFSGSNAGGGSPGGGGGGGGGGSAPKHSAKNASKYDPITDRYATIKSSIDEVQRSVDKLSDAEDDAWGGDKVRNMQKINAELQRQGRNLQKLRKLALDYLDIDQGDAQIAAKDLITNLTEEGLPGLSLDKILFNSDGFVSNRTEITQQLNDYLESLYTPYYEEAMKYDRANSTDEAKAEEIDKLKEKYDVAKAFVDEFLAALDLVDETAQEAADALEQQLENIRTWMANKVEEATYKMEFKIGISDRDISLIEQAIDLWGDLGVKMGKTFDLLGNRLTEETSQFYNTLEHGNRMIEIIENIDPTDVEDAAWFKNEFGEEAWNEYISGNGGLPAEVLEAMQDDADSMIDYMNSMYDTAEKMFGQYIEVLNMYMEEFDKIADKISANNDKLEMFQELLEFSGRRYTSAGRNSIRNIANASVDNAVLEVERAAGALELAEQGAKETSQQLEDFLRDTNKDPSEFDNVEAFTYNQLKAAKDEADQILADAQSDMTSSIQDLASAAADAIEMVAEVIKEEVAANLGGDFASIDDMMTMYDQQYDLDTFFLRDFDKEYQLSSLLGEIEDQMEGITDPERLKEYESLIGEINDANQEGVDLTQTDVDLLKAKFEIQKAQDAYEEAQNAKNTMRLARDASGNWSYVYSADSENTEDAAQRLADAQYNYEKLLWEASDEASQYWLQAQQDFFQFQETIDWARYEHDEQYRAQIDKQLQYYQEKTELYAAQVTKYNDMLGVSFDETSLGVVTNMQDMESAQDWYTQQHEYYTNELNANTQHYQQVVADACNKVGISYDDLEEVVDNETQLMMQENDALRGTIEKLNTEGGRALSQLNTKVSQFRVKFVEDMKLATQALENFLTKLEGYESKSLDRMNYTGFDAYTDYTAAINNYIGEALQSGMTEEELMSDEGLKKLAYELGNKLNSDMLYELEHTTVKGRWNERTSYDAIDYMAGQIAEVMKKMQQGIWERWDEVDEWSEEHREEIQNYGKTASGGLVKTPQVRSLAEEGPELVLNSTDTQNILDAVKHMREVVKLKMSSMNSEIQKKTDGNTQKTIINKDVQQLDQQVHIDATFPNVSVAAEIEEAFNNLVNQAVQYASRK